MTTTSGAPSFVASSACGAGTSWFTTVRSSPGRGSAGGGVPGPYAAILGTRVDPTRPPGAVSRCALVVRSSQPPCAHYWPGRTVGAGRRDQHLYGSVCGENVDRPCGPQRQTGSRSRSRLRTALDECSNL